MKIREKIGQCHSGLVTVDLDRLLTAIDAYDLRYDQVFEETGARLRVRGEAGLADICVLIAWKRATWGAWIKDFLVTPDAEVRRRTHDAFAASGDQESLDALAPLPGFGGKYAMATVVLCAHDPVHYGVVDRRSLKGLKLLECPVAGGRGITLRYLDRVRELRDLARAQRPELTARNVDQGLWVLGGRYG